MRRTAVSRLIPVFFLAISLTLAAAEKQPAPLPKGMFMHAAVKSPAILFENLDEAVTVATDGTRYTLPPGVLPMLFQIYIPFPMGSWDMEQPVDFFLLGDKSPEGFGLMVHADNLEAVLDGLGEEGFAVEEDEGSGYHMVDMDDIGNMYLAEAAPGRVLYADSADAVKQILDAYDKLTLDFWGDGIVTANANLPSGWADEAFREIRRSIGEISAMRENKNPRDIQKIRQLGFSPEVLDALLGLCEKYMPPVLDEIGSLENVAADLRLDGERIGLAIRMGFPDGTLASTMADAAGKRPNPDSPMLKYVDIDAAAINLTTRLEDILPDAYNKLRPMIEVFYGEVFPDQKESMLAFFDDFKAAGVGESVVSSYLDIDSRYNMSWVRAKDAAGLMAAYPKVFESLNAMLDKTILNPSFRFSLSCESLTAADGTEYLKSVLKPEKPEEVEKFLDMLETLGQPNVDAIRQLLDFTQLITAKGDTLVVVAGDVGEDELLKALSAIDSVEDRLMDTDAAQDTLKDMRYRQNAYVLADFDSILLYTAIEMAKAYDQAMSTDLFTDTLDEVLPDLLASEEVMGFAFGAAGGYLLMDMSVPLYSVNTAIRNYEHYVAVLTGQLEDPEHDENGEHWDEEDEDYTDDEEEEIPQFDEPVGAS